ncbi:hypothetical protein [Citreimonas salinaria]|uniref:Type IV pilus biogenesis protein PilP n=1 Tax=Citreimonas salinaria TaxID=321339 RepID=A0A1H3JYI0_9RHOB|nr:hypothetical protein [Citreimonas salinaria]SDY45002.1 hypothetical protein SAMN05444340_10864 [Citreimonas salinaria]
MVSTLALSLSFEGITLLRRDPGGWQTLGHVAVDDPDLNAAMARLRDRAIRADAQGDAVLLLLPEAQIRFLDLPAPDADPAGAARAAMRGATPYAVSELTIDHVMDGATLYVAAVANETLAEAETFARSHGFRPAGFAALPPEGAFPGTVLFGAPAAWDGPAHARPDVPAVILPAQVAQAGDEPAVSEDAAATPPPPDESAPPLTFASRRAAAAPDPAKPADDPTAGPAAAAKHRANDATPRHATRPKQPASKAAPAVDAKIATAAGASAGPAVSANLAAGKAAPVSSSGARPAAPPVTPTALQGAAFRQRILDRAREAQAAASATPEQPSEQPRGRRGMRTERPALAANGLPGGGGAKGRKVGLAVTAALLVALAMVAFWSLRDAPLTSALPVPVASLPPSQDDTPQDPPPLDTGQVPAPLPQTAPQGDDTEVAAREPDDELLDVPAAPDTTALEPPPLPLTPEEAAATYAATGIWQRAPEQPARPETGSVEDLYVASIDPDVGQFDAVALPPARGYAPDAPPADPAPPPPAGVTFTLDDRGLVAATPDGALTPHGHRVFSGSPPAVPPLREAALPAPAPETETGTESDAAAPPASQSAGLRPAARPDDLVEQRERATLQGLSRDELADFRPALRPESAQAQAEPDTPAATDEAVAQSLAPVRRPGTLADVVATVRESAPAQAAPRPQTVPDLPTTAEVARAATVRDAVDLSRTTLFGIYGDASARRALVRLPNGQYEKVKVGDRLDGGQVLAISETELRYRKRGRTITLDMPQG